jgi:transcriptional regulator GlxA family with amidase domain
MLFRSSLTSPLFLDDLDARDLLEFEIPAAILRACANVESRAPRPRVRARDRALRKALELIGDPHAEPVRLEKLSRAVNVSWRTLDYAFREHYGMTPKSYLTAVRLNKARKDLLAAEPGETVEGIAARWGFFHPSRFAARYREQFGELPSQTIG